MLTLSSEPSTEPMPRLQFDGGPPYVIALVRCPLFDVSIALRCTPPRWPPNYGVLALTSGIGTNGNRNLDSSPAKPPHIAYRTKSGFMIQGLADLALRLPAVRKRRGKVQLIFTSPPFPLRTKKRYGNKTGQAYLDWLRGIAPLLVEYLSPNGSIVVELGNAWEKGEPVMSVLGLQALLGFLDSGKLNLCEQFICENPARLPGPAQWVNVERIRVKDSFTHVWWMAPSTRPKADNRRVLKEYSKAMLALQKRGTYNGGGRPSEHHVNAKSFFVKNAGSIPSNVLRFANTSSQDSYLKYCKAGNIRPHPARMPAQLAEFFIKLLTEPKDLVLDPFAGSNTTGATAERLGRRWISIEPESDYIRGSVGRFNGQLPELIGLDHHPPGTDRRSPPGVTR